MKRRGFGCPVGVMAWIALAMISRLAASVSAAADPSRPNIIVIFTDDHGWSDLGAQGIRDDLRTPHLDAIAEGGVRAIAGYVTAPQCVPSRAGLLSGRYQNRFGIEDNQKSVAPFHDEQTIAERLKGIGYATGMAGKWHLGESDRITEHGFDRAFFKHSNGVGFWNMNVDGEEIEPGEQRGGGYHIDLIADFACAFIRKHADRPFFFYLAPRAPHTPLDAPPKYLSRITGEMPERRRQALAMLSAVDDGIGRIMATLRENKLEERTLIFVMGDNGAPLKIHKVDSPTDTDAAGWDGSLNDPLNGEKGMLSEGGIRTPWLACWKGTIPGGQAYPHPVISLDVAATAAAVAGVQTQPGELDGVNLIPHFTGANATPPHERLYWRWMAQSAVREGRWKLLRGGSREYLFDLEADPSEKRNLIAERPEVAGRLRAQLTRWSEGLKPPGIDIEPLTPAATRYFDFYLDGKPVPKEAMTTPPVDPAVRRERRRQRLMQEEKNGPSKAGAIDR